jgi:hypothetical protein
MSGISPQQKRRILEKKEKKEKEKGARIEKQKR